MSTHNVCFYKEVDKLCKLLDCVLVGVCELIQLNIIIIFQISTRLTEKLSIRATCGSSWRFVTHFYISSHDSGRVLWFPVSYLSVCPSICHPSVHSMSICIFISGQ